jgi:hypothetical protein
MRGPMWALNAGIAILSALACTLIMVCLIGALVAVNQ